MTQSLPNSILIATDSAATTVAAHIYEGVGPHLVLIHGIGSSSGDFNPIVHALTEFCQPITLDLRGHGESTKPSAGYHYSDYVSDLEAILQTLKLHRPIVLGHSLGGIITLMWAAQNPDAAHALIIEDSPLRSVEDFQDAFEGWLRLNALPQRTVRDWYANNNPSWREAVLDQRSFDMVNTVRAAIEELQAASLANEGMDWRDTLGQIAAPLLFLQGNPDLGSMVQPDDLRALQSRLPKLEVAYFAESGHTIHRSQPEAWIARVQAFIECLG